MKRALLVTAVLITLAIVNGCVRDDVPAPTISLPEKATEVSIFYSTGRSVIEEVHIVQDDRDIVKTTLNEVLAAKPQVNMEIAIVQPQCKVLDASVDKNGVATINFSKEVLDFKAVGEEKVLAYAALIETLKQFKNIEKVKFQVEGKEKGLINGKDVQKFWGNVSLIGQPRPIDRLDKK